MDIDLLQSMLEAHLPQARVHIMDLRGDGDHYAALVYSPVFTGMTRIQQHRAVYAALQGKMGGELHALALTTTGNLDDFISKTRGSNA